MIKSRFIYLLSLCTLGSFAYAGPQYEVTDVNYFVRETPRFGSSRANITGILGEGAKFELLHQVKRPDGAYAWEIRVIESGENGNIQPSATEKYWVYKSNDRDFRRLGGGSSASETDCPECGGVTPPIPQDQADALADVSRTATRDTETRAPQRRSEPRTPRDTGPVSFDQRIQNYSNSAATQKVIDYAMSHKRRKSQGACYRYVKEALACGPKGRRGSGDCLIPSWYSGVPASGAKNDLKRYGFVNLLEIDPYKTQITSPRQAPKGAVLVYSSGVPCRGTRIPDCGHIEIKTGSGNNPGYVSDYYFDDPINDTPRVRRNGGRTRYRLIGVMVKLN